MNIIILAALAFFFSNILYAQSYNPYIEDILLRISTDTMWQKIGTLQIMERFSHVPASRVTAGFLNNYLRSCDPDTVYYHEFQYNGQIAAPNIIADKYGYSNRDSIIILCGHWDSYAAGAPGADDNASGTAGVLEAARILKDMHFRYTLRFICFSAEEQGLIGSKAYVKQIAGNSEIIVAVLNLDMIAYHKGDTYSMDVLANPDGRLNLFDSFTTLKETYVKGISINKNSHAPGTGTDIMSFWNAGIDGLTIIESADKNYYSPYIHKPQDVLNLSANSSDKMHLIMQAVVAAITEWAVPVIPKQRCGDETGIIASLMVYPNPVLYHARAALILNEDADINLFLYDLSGRLISVLLQNGALFKGYNEIEFSRTALSGGTYLITAATIDNQCARSTVIIVSE